METLEELVDAAIEIALKQVRTNLQPDQALKQTQAVLNLAHAKLCLTGENKPPKRGPGRPPKNKDEAST